MISPVSVLLQVAMVNHTLHMTLAALNLIPVSTETGPRPALHRVSSASVHLQPDPIRHRAAAQLLVWHGSVLHLPCGPEV